MKKWIYSLTVVLFSVATFGNSAIAQTTVETPTEVQAFVDKHFEGRKILQVQSELDGLRKKYNVVLDNAVRLEFNSKFEILEIESKEKLPDSVVPPAILTYVNERFPDQAIVSWEKDDRRQEVKLDNGLALEFDRDGKYIEIDD